MVAIADLADCSKGQQDSIRNKAKRKIKYKESPHLAPYRNIASDNGGIKDCSTVNAWYREFVGFTTFSFLKLATLGDESAAAT